MKDRFDDETRKILKWNIGYFILIGVGLVALVLFFIAYING